MAPTNPDIYAPSVEPSTQAPNDLIRVDANPAAFGSSIAQGVDKLGQGLHQASDFWQQTQTDHQLNGAYQQGEQILANYKKLQGQDALDAQAQTKQQLEQVFAQAGGQLGTAKQKLQFDNTSRAYLDRFLSPQIDNHADQQGQGVAVNTFTDGYKRAVGQVALVADNPQAVEDQITHIADYGANIAHARYGQAELPPEVHDQVLAQAKQAAYKTQVETLAVKNPALAQKVLESHQADLGELYAPLAEHLQSRADYDTGIQAGQKAIANAGQGFLQGQQPLGTQPAAPGGAKPQLVEQPAAGTGPANWETQNNNFAGIRKSGVVAGPNAGGFESYASPEEGVQAIDHLLTTYQDKHGLNTLDGIINRWAPPSDNNDTPLLIQRASQWTGIGPTQPIDLHDPGTKEAVITAMIRNEQGGNLPVSPNVIHAVAQGFAPGGAALGPPNLPSAAFKASAYDQLMADPALRDNPKAFQHALSYVNEQATAASVASMQTEQARKQQSEQAANTYVTDFLNGKTDGLVGRIANDQTLTAETKLHLGQTVEAATAKELGKDTQTYGPQYWNAYQRIHLPDGDPFKITSPQQLYSWGPKGDLTVAGIDNLTKEIQAKNTPEGEAEATMRRSFLTNARSMITGANEHFGQTDPKGDELFLKFQAQFWPQYEKARAAGESPETLLNPDSSKYLGPKTGSPFIRPAAQWQSDLSLANAPVAAPGDSANQNAPPADLTTKEGILQAARSGRLDYWHATDLLNKLGVQTPGQSNGVPLAK